MPTVAIIGRPNVGKSTLFNELLGERRAIESDIPGTTRDRVFGNVKGEKVSFLLVDTGGLSSDMGNDIEENMKKQAEESVQGADLIYFCIDSRAEITSEEWMIAEILRKKKPKHVPIFLISTKAEKPSASQVASELYALGISQEDPIFISAKEGYGIRELLQKTEKALLLAGFSPKSKNDEEEYVAKISILGRPNAGKSTLVNTLSGRDVSIVSPLPGTTRDNVDSVILFEKERYLLIDTAGIRKKSKMHREDLERFSRLRALSALSRADVAIILIDATEGITHQDQTIAAELIEAGVGVMIAFSKWDIRRDMIRQEVADKSVLEEQRTGEKPSPEDQEKEVSKLSISVRDRFLRQAQREFPFLSWAPVLFLSSVEKKGIQEVFRNAKRIMTERTRTISTANLNIFLEQALAAHPPASRKNMRLKVKYGTQIGKNPPHFVFFANDPDAAHFSFRRYIENRLRELYGFWGTPIRVEIRKKSNSNPYSNSKS
ncbi:ribosome biogenesis GTPase Der [Candidatus Peregrinibacteria bacterium]|nr:MAG: ribosome biogenesis GTPase Der [Candidatus Peregrinibacteria bacterium]